MAFCSFEGHFDLIIALIIDARFKNKLFQAYAHKTPGTSTKYFQDHRECTIERHCDDPKIIESGVLKYTPYRNPSLFRNYHNLHSRRMQKAVFTVKDNCHYYQLTRLYQLHARLFNFTAESALVFLLMVVNLVPFPFFCCRIHRHFYFPHFPLLEASPTGCVSLQLNFDTLVYRGSINQLTLNVDKCHSMVYSLKFSFILFP